MAHRNIAESRFLDANKEPKQDLAPIEGYEQKPLVSLEQAVIPIKETLYNLDSKLQTAKRNSRNPSDGLDSDEGVIWRGVREDLSDQYNDDCIWWGVSSCTKTLKVTEDFVGRVGKRTLFNIECINGKAIKAHSYIKLEDEIILMPGTYLRVVSKSNPAEDLHIIHLQETAPPYQTIAPPFVLPPTAVEPPSLINRTISTEREEIEPSASVASTQSLGNDFFETLQDRAFRGGGFFMIT